MNNLRTEVQYIKNSPKVDENLEHDLKTAQQRIQTLTIQLDELKNSNKDDKSKMLDDKNQKILMLEEKLELLSKKVDS